MTPSNAIDGRLRGLFTGLALPGSLLALLLGTIGWQTGVLQLPRLATGTVAGPQTTMVEPRAFAYRVAGAYQFDDGKIIDAQIVDIARPPPLEIMTHQVTVGEYSRCIAAAACTAPQGKQIADTYPVTGVSFDDASDYASWLSAATGDSWRLPTVEEWVFAAAEQSVDPALGVADNSDNPADRWLAAYEREASLGPAGGVLGPVGSTGTNSLGVADLAGTVWEWTATCDSRTTLDTSGQTVSRIESCGVRLLEGQHRTPMSTFIRDARTGGCSTGRPPDALGFRLVHERGRLDRLLSWGMGLLGSR